MGETAQTVKIQTPAASVDHPSHWQAILAAIMAALNAVTPIVVHIVPPQVAAGIALAEAVEPVIVQTVVAISAAGQTTVTTGVGQ